MDFERWLDEVATERARLNRDVKALVDGHWQTLLQVNAAAREARQKLNGWKWPSVTFSSASMLTATL